MDYSTTEGDTGHVGFISNKQPVLEKHLRDAMASSCFCQLRANSTVLEIQQDDDWTYCRYRGLDGELRSIRSRFFVGADGKTGFTSKNYLEPLGILMEQAHGAFYDETWVALNWKVTLPTMATHPDFPLWKLKYTPEQVYDLFFHSNFRFLCNPKRPAICTRFGLPSDRLWRFEFVVLKGEDGDEMASPKGREKSFFPYLTHAGNDTGSRKMCNIPGTASASLGRDRSGYLHAAATSGLMAALSCVAMRRTCSSIWWSSYFFRLPRRCIPSLASCFTLPPEHTRFTPS